MFHNCEGQSHKTVSTDHTFEEKLRRAEADLNLGPSAYRPNALLLGQTGSHRSLSLTSGIYTSYSAVLAFDISSTVAICI